jgi:hypothetical protein
MYDSNAIRQLKETFSDTGSHIKHSATETFNSWFLLTDFV